MSISIYLSDCDARFRFVEFSIKKRDAHLFTDLFGNSSLAACSTKPMSSSKSASELEAAAVLVAAAAAEPLKVLVAGAAATESGSRLRGQ